MKAIIYLSLLLLSSPLFAADAADSSNEAYYRVLVDLGFNILLTFFYLGSLIALSLLCLYTYRTFINPTLMQQLGDKPMTGGRIIGALAVISFMHSPLNAIALFSDFTGIGSSGLCLTVKVDVSHMTWNNNANACITNAEDKFASLAQYTDQSHIESANIGLLFGVVQLISLGFFLSSSWMLFMHMLGSREVAMTKGAAIFSMMVATIFMSAPDWVDYIEDFRGSQSEIINTNS